jgi:phytoene desaturase
MKRACVIGAGLGGLALAIRLQAGGIATSLVEAREAPGGCAGSREREGFTFDAGPMSLIDPAVFEALWQLSGERMSDQVELMPIAPIMRFNWPDGVNFDYSADPAALRREIARISPGDAAGYEDFARAAGSAL